MAKLSGSGGRHGGAGGLAHLHTEAHPNEARAGAQRGADGRGSKNARRAWNNERVSACLEERVDMAYGKGGRQRAVVGGRDVGLRHDLVVRVKETVGLRGADARMRAHCRRDGARRRAPSCAAHSGVARAAGSDGLVGLGDRL